VQLKYSMLIQQYIVYAIKCYKELRFVLPIDFGSKVLLRLRFRRSDLWAKSGLFNESAHRLDITIGNNYKPQKK